ncbi:hypothetical protein [Sinomicrobium weinanense]|uniref:Uncharacterized protein n=1 Tax=Sinomicrobium weinanense TaxID=2842200 RepID=A0A926JQ11_9FLAO|nr:hypothetical protein [Sinomicrobium weinanense]MBC9795274.1 hypothetical protein [Sinomicrobium weinanense]MBU3125746.1 hypothetical protein [Sinomicrobium weinanense]
MAFGFPPKCVQDIPFNGMDKSHFLIIAIDTAFDLGWKMMVIDETGFIARTRFSWRSWTEEVTMDINNEKATIKSECPGSQILDWGKNKINITAFLKAFKETKSRLTREEIEDKLTNLRKELKKEHNEEDTDQ